MSDQYGRAKELFLEAITHREEERDAFLVAACEGDAELLARTRELIASDRDEDSLLDRNAAELMQRPAEEATTIVSNDAASQLGTLGRYRIVRRVGEGGMGTVYEARQDSPSRTVALKVISSALVTPELLRRFEHETQVLGRLQHPGIAQIFEADRVETENGMQPFFAMEYIRGVPITDFVERNKLRTRQRLELLAKVCDAIEHAHQRGVIHRDLKPANILVDESGQPKILDFGVARATDGDVQAATMRTDIGQLVGTLPYMSPEQASGDPDEIDIRSDVYALGVVAYELLAGRMPYDVRQQMIHEAVRVIREQDPTPLSSVNRVFRGDVETIVGKSLEKPKMRRYQSAAALASDIRRYLGDQPIEARPQSTWYQFAKFTRRNKPWAIGAVAFVLALVAGLIATGLVAREATRQRDIAREASALATREAASKAFVAEFLTNMFNVSDPSEARGNSISARELLDVGAQKLDQLDDEQTRADLAATIGGVYSGLGLFDQAESLLVQALAEHRRLKGDDHPDTIKLMHTLGVVYQDKDRIDEGEALFTEAFDRAANVLGAEDRMTLIIKVSLGAMQSRRGDYAGAGATFSSALETQERVLDADDPAVLSAMNLLAVNYRIQARYEESEAMFNRALTRARRVHGTDHPRTLEMMRLLGSLYRELEREEEAEAILTEAVGIQSRVLGEDHTETLATYNTLGHVYIELKRFEEAERVFASTLEASRRVRGEEHVDTTLVMVNLALAYKRLERYEDAAALYRETLEIQQRTLGMEHADTAIALFQLANVNRTLGKYDESAKYYEQAIVVDTKALGENHPYVADDLEEYGKLRRLMGDDAKADELIARAEAIREARKAK